MINYSREKSKGYRYNTDFKSDNLFIKSSLSKNNPNNVVGFISQHRISENSKLYTMTPGVSFKESNEADQRYRSIKNVDCDFFIVGRTLYNSDDIIASINDLFTKTLEN